MNLIRCRACLTVNAAEYIHMESVLTCGKVSYLEFFNQCTQLQVELDDNTPHTLCNSCSNDLTAAYMFVQTALQSNATLYAELNSVKDCKQVSKISGMGHELIALVDGAKEGSEFEMEIVLLENEELNLTEEEYLEEFVDSENKAENNILSPKLEPASPTELDYFPEDECDDEYTIEYNEEEQPFILPHIKLESETAEDKQKRGSKWRCTECKRVLRGDVSYVGHMNMHKDKRPYACAYCRCAFRCKTSLNRHIEKRHDNLTKNENKISNNDFACQDCAITFDTHVNLNEHIQLVHEMTEPYNCNFCTTKTTIPREEVIKHMEKEHVKQYLSHFFKPNSTELATKSNTLQCRICHRQLLKKNFEKHMLMHKRKASTKDEKVLCAYCRKYF